MLHISLVRVEKGEGGMEGGEGSRGWRGGGVKKQRLERTWCYYTGSVELNGVRPWERWRASTWILPWSRKNQPTGSWRSTGRSATMWQRSDEGWWRQPDILYHPIRIQLAPLLALGENWNLINSHLLLFPSVSLERKSGQRWEACNPLWIMLEVDIRSGRW